MAKNNQQSQKKKE
jgi:hypothetical protein